MNNLNHKDLIKINKYKKLSIKGMGRNELIKLYDFMNELRMCEEALSNEYHPADEMKCPVHFCTGQEAVPAALSLLLKKDDYLFSHHRSHGYYLAKKAPMNKLFAEIYGKETGANSGLAGSQDISFPENNFFSGAILAGAVAISVGTAMALKFKKNNKRLSVSGFGEAATDEGIFWESVNYASLNNLPAVFICENNNYSVFSPQSKRQSGEAITKKVNCFGVESKAIFGNDVCLVYKELKKAFKKARNKNKPFLLETFTYRYDGHVGPTSDDLNGYRSKREVKFWKDNCPIKLLEKELMKKNIINSNYKEKLKKKIRKKITECFSFAKKSKFPKFDNFEHLNISNLSKEADKKLKDIEKSDFDEEQDLFQPKGY
jgi:TPP-dependent pyruvate/acetoin dehydrogenase alpha subunit